MQSHVRHFAAMASLGLAIVVSAPTSAQLEGPNEQMVNLVIQIQQLQDEIRMLRGQLDEQTFELENLKRRQRDQYLDLDQRISELSSGLPAGVSGGVSRTPTPASASAPTPAPTTTPTPPGGMPSVTPPSTGPRLADEGPDVSARAETPSAVTALAVPEVATTTTAATPEAQQAAYDEAFQALKELRYADAAQGFQDFLIAYPGSSLSGNAQYWLGESYYVTRNYEIALSAFQTLLRDYPDSTKRGDGLLKIGFTHYELDQFDEARAALEQVQRDYPNTPLARLADSRLRSMRLEGQF